MGCCVLGFRTKARTRYFIINSFNSVRMYRCSDFSDLLHCKADKLHFRDSKVSLKFVDSVFQQYINILLMFLDLHILGSSLLTMSSRC